MKIPQQLNYYLNISARDVEEYNAQKEEESVNIEKAKIALQRYKESVEIAVDKDTPTNRFLKLNRPKKTINQGYAIRGEQYMLYTLYNPSVFGLYSDWRELTKSISNLKQVGDYSLFAVADLFEGKVQSVSAKKELFDRQASSLEIIQSENHAKVKKS